MSDKKKIDLFKDKEYEEFDWLNKAIEPLLFSIADSFAAIPSVVEISFEKALEFANDSYSEINFRDLIPKEALPYDELNYLSDFFILEMDGGTELEVDLRDIPKDKMIRLRKTVDHLPEDFQRQYVSLQMNRILTGYRRDERHANIGRINEVMDIIGCNENRRSRSVYYKMSAISATMSKIVLEDKWRIRNLDLAIKAARWITHYVFDGNLASFQNLIKMKCMTHNGDPIYSVQETV